MSVKITKKDGSNLELEFVVSKERFNLAIDEAFKKSGSKFKIPGFRNGKVPKNVIEKTYGEGVMYDDAFNIIADEEYIKAIEENNLEIVSQPEVDIKEIGKDKDLIFTIKVCVKPEIKLDKYIGLEIKKSDLKVTDKDVAEELEKLRVKNARMVTKETGSVENTDTVTIDFEGFLKGVPFEGGKGEKYDLEIGSNSFIPGFEEQLIGMNTGDEKEIKTTFPESYGNNELAGKETVFKIKLHEIKKKELAKLDDEFAKDSSEFDTLKEYTLSIKKRLEEEKVKAAKVDKEVQVLDKLVEAVKVELPEPMIEAEIDRMLKDFEQNLSSQGITLDKYLEILNTTIEDIKLQFRENAIKDIKLKLAIEYVQNKEDFKVADKDIDAKIEELAKSYGKEEETENFKKNPNIREYMISSLKQEKTIELLLNSAIEK